MLLIDKRKLKHHYAWWGNDHEVKKLFDEIIDQQPVIECDDWTLVSERAPKTDGLYIVTIEGAYRATCLAYHKESNGWYDENYEPYRVIAWKEFPAAYRD